jgi:hypothetical protein
MTLWKKDERRCSLLLETFANPLTFKPSLLVFGCSFGCNRKRGKTIGRMAWTSMPLERS